MDPRIETLREQHRLLREHADELCEAARALAVLDVEAREAIRRHLVEFLRERVAPLATIPMNYDHLAIRRWIGELEQADAHNLGRLQQLLYGLHALITVHMWKEEELFCAALESGPTRAQVSAPRPPASPAPPPLGGRRRPRRPVTPTSRQGAAVS
jgi:hypothetical protein